MLRTSRMSSPELQSMLQTFKLKLKQSVINILRMSSFGPSTELESRSSLLGWEHRKKLASKDYLNHPTWMRSRL